MRTIAIIPARMGSTRFPGKPLATLLGKPMIEHVYRRALSCELIDAVYVATCDDEINTVVERFGGRTVMTSPAHERASDRVAEAAELIERAGEPASDLVVMIQGDEPMITPEMVESAVAPMFGDEEISCVNLVKRICSREEHLDPNTIKVVMDARNDALYFSRSPIPFGAIDGEGRAPVFKQVCVIPFRRAFLDEFSRLAPTSLGQAESIDMLRALEHGKKIRLVETPTETHSVDTPTDLAKVEALMKQTIHQNTRNGTNHP
jgi:3-deoxy-manno-octulosonate cytidylyltransferase (CMP-KDO synthetase)